MLQASAIQPVPIAQSAKNDVPEIVEVKPTFGIVDPQVIRNLNENNPWQERTAAIEQLEQCINAQAT